MLCPPVSSSNSQEPMEVDEEEQVEIKEEDDSLKALPFIDRVRVFVALFLVTA